MRSALLLVALLAVASGSAADARKRPQVRVDATPSAVVAAEMALSRLAREKGASAAFLETATPDAIVFAPDMVAAQGALRKNSYPLQPMRWTARRVLMSCDGALAIASGAWQGENSASGQFVTVWQRQGDGRGRKDVLKQWKWIASATTVQGGPVAAASAEDVTESIETKVASCAKAPSVRPPSVVPATRQFLKEGTAGDRSLLWRAFKDGNGTQKLVADVWNGTMYDEFVLDLPDGATGAAS